MRTLILIVLYALVTVGCGSEKKYENIDFSYPEEKKDTVILRDTIRVVEVDTFKVIESPPVVEIERIYERDTIDIENSDRTIGAIRISDLDDKLLEGNINELLCDYVCAFPLLDTSIRVTSDYGLRFLNGNEQFHHGVDITSNDTFIYSAGNGVVDKIGYDRRSGLYVKIKHELVSTFYAHLNDLYVIEGDTVSVLDTIGVLGNSGNTTGPHLHFEIRKNNNSINVFDYYKKVLNIEINE